LRILNRKGGFKFVYTNFRNCVVKHRMRMISSLYSHARIGNLKFTIGKLSKKSWDFFFHSLKAYKACALEKSRLNLAGVRKRKLPDIKSPTAKSAKRTHRRRSMAVSGVQRPSQAVQSESIRHTSLINPFNLDDPLLTELEERHRPVRPTLSRNRTIPIHRPIAEPGEVAPLPPKTSSYYARAMGVLQKLQDYSTEIFSRSLAGFVRGKQWQDYRYPYHNFGIESWYYQNLDSIRHGVITIDDCMARDDFHVSPWKIYRFSAYHYFSDYVPDRDNLILFWEVEKQFTEGKLLPYEDKWGKKLSATGADMI